MAQGPNYSISSACASGNFCIQNAANHIIKGDADLMLAGSSDAAILPIGMAGFMAARALSRRNDDPATASRPWDLDRDGFVMGEGAGVLCLEELEHARARGATIYAEFLGGAYTCDAHHMTEPHPEGKGVSLAIETALKSSGVARERVNYVNAHGTSTPAGDLAEYKAIRKALPGPNVRINSTKSMIGAWYCAGVAVRLGIGMCVLTTRLSVRAQGTFWARLGLWRRWRLSWLCKRAWCVRAAACAWQRGCGAWRAASALLVLSDSPLTVFVAAAPEPEPEEPGPGGGLEHPCGRHRAEARGAPPCRRPWLGHRSSLQPVSSACWLTPLPLSRARPQVDVALSNSFGFGGHNSCILFSAFKD